MYIYIYIYIYILYIYILRHEVERLNTERKKEKQVGGTDRERDLRQRER